MGSMESMNGKMMSRIDDENLPPGFRFHPMDEELVTYYLHQKVLDSSFSCRAIAEADLNKCEPWDLPARAKVGEKEWYFFSLRDRKYPTGLRTNRATQAGYWKATGKDREVFKGRTSILVGMKKTLVFYRGRAPKGEKSNWVMHEYRLEGKYSYSNLPKTAKVTIITLIKLFLLELSDFHNSSVLLVFFLDGCVNNFCHQSFPSHCTIHHTKEEEEKKDTLCKRRGGEKLMIDNEV